jgi:hypothetical protein
LINPKIIYISFIRLTDKISSDWFINYCAKKGAEIEYWDIVSLVREEHQEVGALDVDYLRYITSYKELESLIQKPDNQNAVYVMLISYSGRFSKPFLLLSKYHRKMVFISWGAVPIEAKISEARRFVYRLFYNPIYIIKSFFSLILGHVYRNLNLVKKFDIVFSAGSKLNSIDQYAKKVVHFNLCDFDHYRRLIEKKDKLIKKKYAVFLDINLPYQSDLVNSGLPAVNSTSYFNSINHFFDLLEDTFNIKVIIAAHPKASYINDEFNKRKIYRLCTPELVKDAEFVITHTSTAISYAVLNYKPALFIYTDEMENIYKYTIMREIRGVASYLKMNMYNIDKEINSIHILEPNRESYDQYKYTFLTSPDSENLTSAEIFWREINAI